MCNAHIEMILQRFNKESVIKHLSDVPETLDNCYLMSLDMIFLSLVTLLFFELQHIALNQRFFSDQKILYE